MAREVQKIMVKDGDNELHLQITPMDAVKAEQWLIRAGLALGGSVTQIQQGDGVQALAKALSTVEYEKVAPLWNELLSCCSLESGGAIISLTPETISGKIEFPTTLFLIKAAALKANFGFFGKGGLQNFLTTMRGVLSF